MLDNVKLMTLSDLPLDVQEFINKIFPNGFLGILTQLLAFLVLVLAITFLMYKPVKKILKKRADYVEGNIKEAEEAKRLALEHEEESRKNILASKKKAQNIVEEAKDSSERIKTDLLLEAKLEAEKMKSQAEKDIQKSQEKAQDDIHKAIVTVALDASKEVVGREINDKDNERLIDDFIKDVNNG